MSTWFYTFQLTRVHPIELRSNIGGDTDLMTFGVALNKRDQGHGSAVVPMFRNSNIGGKALYDQSVQNGFVSTIKRERMTKDWTLGPTEIRDGDAVDIVVAGTNTNDSQLPTADQQKMDRLTIDFLNVYYSWLVGNFVSTLGLEKVVELIGLGGGAFASYLADPVGRLLGWQAQGPCNGMVFAGTVSLSANDLEALDWTPDPARYAAGPKELSVVTRSYDDSVDHDTNVCGTIARTEIDVTIRRAPTWSLQKENFVQRVTSVRERYGDLESLTEAVPLRI